nr:mmyGI [uncultured bacterium]
MRVLFVCSVSTSHLIPMVPLAWALRAAGHDVRVACSADSAPGALATGLAVTLVGGDGDFAENHRRNLTETSQQHGHGGKDHLVNLFARSALDMMDGLFTVVDNWQPHAMVYEPVAFAAEVVAATRPVATFRHLWGPDLLATTPGQWLRHRVHESLADEFHARGASPAEFHDQFVIDPCPQELQRIGVGTPIPVRYIPVDRPGPVPSWLMNASPAERICVTWGTFGDAMPTGHPFIRMLERLAGIGKEILLVVPPADLERLPELPGAVRPVTGAPLHAVLPACSAILHHGGANTMLDAVVRGIPQLVVSDTFERALNGERLAATGAGIHLTARQADDPVVEQTVRDMFAAPQWAEKAESLRAQTASRPSPAEVASVLEGLSERKAAHK